MVRKHDTADILSRIQQMDAYEFEQFIADVWARQGWNTSVSQASLDAGIDVTATKETPYPQKQLIQVKRYGPNTTVSGPEIQQYASLKQQEAGVDSVVVVTSNRFSSHAIDRARDLNVKTVDSDNLLALIDRLNAHDLVDEYTTAETSVDTLPSQTDTSASRENTLFDTITSKTGGLSWPAIPPDTYLGFILIGSGVWSLYLLLVLIGHSGGSIGSIVSIAALNSWIMLPPALYVEAKRVSETTDWTPFRPLYALGGAIPFLNAAVGGVYVYRRQQAYQRIDETTTGTESDETTTMTISSTEVSSSPQDDAE